MMRRVLMVAAAALILPACAGSQKTTGHKQRQGQVSGKTQSAFAELKNQQGEKVGEVQLRQAPNGIIADVSLTGVPAGEHAFHIHEVGKCEAPFTSAGGHYNPGKKHQHGIENPKGQHAGDMPNLHVPADGKLQVTLFLDQVTFEDENPLFDEDGSAFIIHAGPDDYSSDPAGNAGDRIACGVVQKSAQ